jgi:hypothetical protein
MRTLKISNLTEYSFDNINITGEVRFSKDRIVWRTPARVVGEGKTEIKSLVYPTDKLIPRLITFTKISKFSESDIVIVKVVSTVRPVSFECLR